MEQSQLMKPRTTIAKAKQPTPIEWGDIHRRLDNTRSALEGGWALTSEEKNRILRNRAKLLAREPEKDKRGEEHLDVVEFLLAYESYAIQSSYVREVCSLTDLTVIPCTPPFVLGIINVRGQILSVVDLRKLFDLPQKGLTDLNKVIIIHDDKMEFGVLADAVLGVRTIPLEEIQPSLPTLTGIRGKYLKGITRERLVVLDANEVLSDQSTIINEEP